MTAEPVSLVRYDVFPLSTIRGGGHDELATLVEAQLRSFKCARSTHIQEFAQGGVHRWEKHGHSRTYVLLKSDGDSLEIPAFFTVGMTSLDLSRASANMRKKLMGDISLTQTGAFSIAELARSDDYSSEQLPGAVILDEAKEVIKRARALVGGRFLVVDSREQTFERLYAPAGFKMIDVATAPIGMEGTGFVTSCAVIKDW